MFFDHTNKLAQAVIARNAGRPIPIPSRPWASYQSWDTLLMCHWQIDPAALRPLVPAELEIDTYQGQAYVGLIPMFMGEIKMHGLGSIPTEPHFPEINFRTYVRYAGRTGVYFFHIDAEALLADIGARLFFHTPYLPALVKFEGTPETGFYFRSHRVLPPHPTFEARYRPLGQPAVPAPGSLQEFQSERYSAFARTIEGRIVRGDLIHDPWLIQDVDLQLIENTVLQVAGLTLPAQPTNIHYAPGLKVVLWTFEDVTTS